MAVCSVRFFGEALQQRSGLEVFVPQRGGPFPVLYLLHGLSDDYTCWGRLTPLLRLARAYPLMVVAVNGARSFYTNDPRPGGYAYEDHIVRDVVEFVEATFPARPERAARAVAGLSMGGYGAMMLALKYPETFSAVSAHSSAFFFAAGTMPGRNEYSDYLAEKYPDGRYSVFALAEGAAGGRVVPAIRFDCGRDDALLETNRRFHRHLESVGLAHEYREFDGAHSWEYWDEHIRDTLAFLARHFDLPQA